MNRISSLSETYSHYLSRKKMGESTIREHLACVKRFSRWLRQTDNRTSRKASHKDLYRYLCFLREKKVGTAALHNYLCSLRYYFAFLHENGFRKDNPASGLKLEPRPQPLEKKLLSLSQLEILYQRHAELFAHKTCRDSTIHAHLRNTCMLSFLIFQAGQVTELKVLQTGHLNLPQGKVQLPATSRGEARELPLHPMQVIHLHEYLRQVRPCLLSKHKAKYAEEEILFPGQLNQLIQQLCKRLRILCPELRNLSQLRNSIAVEWLRTAHKREVQYRLGFRSIQSLERYERQNVSGLTDLLSRAHPFG